MTSRHTPDDAGEALGSIFQRLLPDMVAEAIEDHIRYAPDDSVCPRCTRFFENHAGLEQILALRKLKYWDEEKHMMQYPRGAIPYCNCDAGRMAEPPRPRYSE
jgi:hypothetical protein